MVILNLSVGVNIDNVSGKLFYKNSKIKMCFFDKNNVSHRYYGPAIICYGEAKKWCFNRKFYGRSDDGYNQKQFLKDLTKEFLI